MQVVGRGRESENLRRFRESPRAGLLALYGRRRVGKTYLIRQLFEKNAPYFEVTGRKDGSKAIQLHTFSESLRATFGSSAVEGRLTSWRKAFEILTKCLERVPKDRTCVLFFDELPWLATPRSGLLQELDYYWNTQWSRDDRLKIILCGSAASWMLEKLVHAKGGLHNRLTQTILLEPFLLRETKEYLEARGITWPPELVAEVYMAVGGVPYYLDQIPPGLSPVEAVQQAAFRRDGLLYAEFESLFHSLFDGAEQHLKLVRTIARSRRGVERRELSKAAGLKSGGSLKRPLEELQAAGFIERYVPYGKHLRNQRYRIVDEYALFYLRWIEPLRLRGLSLPDNHWQSQRQSPAWRAWSGYSFEGLCLKHAGAVRSALGLRGVACDFGTWSYRAKPGSSERGAQIDLLIDRADRVISLCEVKYSESPLVITRAVADELRRKMTVFRSATGTRKHLQWVLLSPYGVLRSPHAEALQLQDVRLDELLAFS